MVESGPCQVCSTLSSSWCSLCRTVFYCSKEHQKEDWARHKEDCTRQRYELQENEKLGRFLVASEEMKADMLVFKDRPVVLGPKPGLLDMDDAVCLGCFKFLSNSGDLSSDEENVQEISNIQCPKCALPVCSDQCSSQYFHKNFECKLFREATQAKLRPAESGGESSEDGGKVIGQEVRDNFLQNILFFRCILLQHVDPAGDWKKLMSLQSNNEYREDLPNLEKSARIFEEMKNTLASIGHPTINSVSKPDLHKILGIVDTNGIDFKVSSSVELTGLYPTFSMMEYSCIPSTKYYFAPASGKKARSYDLYVRSGVDLKKGDHLSVTISNLLWNTQKRREELKKTKYFWCECQRCSDPYELESNFSSILCPLPGCKSVSIPVPKQPGVTTAGNSTNSAENGSSPPSPTSLMSPGVSTDREFQWQCTNKKCGKTCETWQVKKVDSKLSEAIGRLSSNPTIDKYKELVRQFEELVHPGYYLTFVVNHSLIQMQGHDDATRNDKQVLEDKLNICNKLLGTVRKLDPGLAKLNLYTAVIYFEMHSAILGIVGGEGDEDYKILRNNPETVKLGRIYLQKCIDCFKYELTTKPETKLKILAVKKLEYLNMLIKHSS